MKFRINLWVKWLLLKTIIILARRYPPLTEENVWHPNAKIWFNIWKQFQEYELREIRKVLFDACFRVFIDEYQRHTFYQRRIDFVVDELRKSNYLPRSSKPMSFWGETRQAQEGTIFSPETLDKIMKSSKTERTELIQDFLISAGEGRVTTSPKGCSEGGSKK